MARKAKRAGKLRKGPRRVTSRTQSAKRKPAPRPEVDYTYDLSERICERICDGETVTSICAEHGMPTYAQLTRWLRRKPDFERRYKLAGEAQTRFWVSEAMDRADRGRTDVLGAPATHARALADCIRQEVDLRKWFAARRLRHEYGEHVALTGGGKDDNAIGLKVETRGELIDSILSMIHPKPDGTEKPNKVKREE